MFGRLERTCTSDVDKRNQVSSRSFVKDDVVRARNARFVLIRDGYDDRVAIRISKRFESEVDFL